mgnify:CR=1 FL=1
MTEQQKFTALWEQLTPEKKETMLILMKAMTNLLMLASKQVKN